MACSICLATTQPVMLAPPTSPCMILLGLCGPLLGRDFGARTATYTPLERPVLTVTFKVPDGCFIRFRDNITSYEGEYGPEDLASLDGFSLASLRVPAYLGWGFMWTGLVGY